MNVNPIEFDHTQPTNQQWKCIIEQNLQVAKSFEIQCWSEETDWIDAALQYGEEKETEWSYGKVITGKVTPGLHPHDVTISVFRGKICTSEHLCREKGFITR